MTSRTLTAVVVAGFALISGLGVATAEEGRYGHDWRVGADGINPPEAMIIELRALIDEAERARAADPLFLRDLRDLARRHSWPWHQRLLFDDFSDGDLDQNPSWSVAGRNIVVDRFNGVRSRVVPPRHGRKTPGQDRLSNRDLALQLFSTLIQQQTGGDPSQAGPPQRPADMQPVKLTADVAVPNVFAVRIRVTSENRDVTGARLEFGVTQGPGDLGYRVAYNPGAEPSVELLRVGSRGTAVIDASRQPVSLEDDAMHVIQLTRAADGAMAVSIDEAEILRTLDQGFRDPFDGVVIVNKGGDFTLRAVTAYGE